MSYSQASIIVPKPLLDLLRVYFEATKALMIFLNPTNTHRNMFYNLIFFTSTQSSHTEASHGGVRQACGFNYSTKTRATPLLSRLHRYERLTQDLSSHHG